MESTDRSLIDAHLGGDRTAFGELVRRYGDSLLGYLTRVCGDREQAEDLFQETFRRVHEKAHTLRGNHFKNWLYTIATRVAIDGLRRRRRIRVVSLNQKLDCDGENCDQWGAVAVAESCSDPSQEAIRVEQKEQVWQALDSLPARQRATLVLAYYQGLSYREVADVMGCSIGTVRTQMFRALRTLARTLPDVSGVAK
jgi:RNA polymerase sigma-70 factor (ECF subfamily)